MVTRRLKDISILSKDDGMLNEYSLAYRLLLQQESRYGLFIDVALVEGSSAVRQYGSIVLHNQGGVDKLVSLKAHIFTSRLTVCVQCLC